MVILYLFTQTEIENGVEDPSYLKTTQGKC